MKKIKSIRYKLLIPVAVVVLAAGVIMGLALYQGIKGGMVFMGVDADESDQQSEIGEVFEGTYEVMKDVFEEIADDLNRLLGRINEQSNIAMEVAEGNLCVEVNPLSEHDLLGNALKQLVERNAHTLRGIRDTAVQAKNGSSQMAVAAGKGFAVVAEEVRNLAGKCADASEQTTELISTSIEKAGAGSELAGDAASSFDKIREIVNKGEAVVNTIAGASDEQTVAIFQINEAVTHVSEAVQSNSSASEQCASASSELSGQMEDVDRMLSVYKL